MSLDLNCIYSSKHLNSRTTDHFAFLFGHLQTLFKKIASSPSKPPSRMSIESGPFTFHYVISGDVVYLALVEKAYPKKLAFQYLDELEKEFSSLYGPQIEAATRPYAFIKFDTFIQKTKKLYLDTRTQRNIAKLNADIAEVQSIMTRNIQDVLGQGERLDRMTEMSHMLSQDSRQLAKSAKKLYHDALLRKYTPWAVISLIAILVLFVRWKFY